MILDTFNLANSIIVMLYRWRMFSDISECSGGRVRKISVH